MDNTCEICGKTFTPSKFTPYKRFCSQKCKDRSHYLRRVGQHKRIQYQNLRIQVINLLGGRCVACGCEDRLLLTIDHIFNDRNGKKSSLTFFRKLLSNPEWARKNHQLLCWNHNNLKQIYPNEFEKRFPNLKARPVS
jgi:hypothetical protein